MVQMLPRSHKEWNPTLHLPPSQASECRLVHTLNFIDDPRSIFKSAFTQPNELSFPCLLNSGDHIKQSLAILSKVFHVIINLHFNLNTLNYEHSINS